MKILRRLMECISIGVSFVFMLVWGVYVVFDVMLFNQITEVEEMRCW